MAIFIFLLDIISVVYFVFNLTDSKKDERILYTISLTSTYMYLFINFSILIVIAIFLFLPNVITKNYLFNFVYYYFSLSMILHSLLLLFFNKRTS
ncbi:hypothetical protein Q9Y_02836 [Enterococcus faecalis EnGen0081]|nr:hypothetical protein Q9Y_02836 [Enterococcus faecalis EnGen0081]